MFFINITYVELRPLWSEVKQVKFALTAIALITVVGWGQSRNGDSPSLPEFEVVSIRSHGEANGQTRVRLQFLPGGRFLATGISARLLIGEAYSVKEFQIIGGPSWIGRQQYSIEATAGESRKGPFFLFI